MSNELLASKVVITEEEPRVRQILGVPTNILGMIGITEKGPVGELTRTTSFDEWVDIYGGAIADGDAYHAVQGFYRNGGQVLDFVRTVHYTDVDTPATKTSDAASYTIQTPAGAPTSGTVLGTASEPFDLEPGDTLDITTDLGGPTTATFTAAAATVTGTATAPFALTDGWTLTFEVDNGPVQTVTFNTSEFVSIGAATAEEVAAVINAEATGIQADVVGNAVRITSDTRGADSDLDTFGGTALAALGFTGLSDSGAGSSNVADIEAVTVAEVKTIVELAVTGVTVTDESGSVRITRDTAGAPEFVQVVATSTADDELGLDNATHNGTDGSAVDTLKIWGKYDGTYAHDLTIRISRATSLEAARFNLTVLDAGLVVETYPNLTMDTADDNYVETVINDEDTGSHFITAEDLSASGTAEQRRPAGGHSSPSYSPTTYGPLAGGDDGLASIDDNDFLGSSAGPTGLRVLDESLDLALLAIPDRPTNAVHNGMISYCEDTRDGQCFAILDPPAGETKTSIITYVETTASLLNLSEYGAIYWPQVKVLNPNTTVFGNDDTIVVPPSGHIAGAYARTDGAREGGVYDQPAGIERGILRGVVGFEDDAVKQEAARDLIYPKRINPITTSPGLPIHIDGSRTLKGNGNFPSVAERRGVIYIEQSVKLGVQFARHANNDDDLRARVDRSITAFLLIQYRNNAFRGTSPANSFFVDVGDGLNPPSSVFAGKLIARIGLATQKPAEFIILRFSQDTRELEEEIAAATA